MTTPIVDAPRLPAGPLVEMIDRLLSHVSYGVDPRHSAVSTERAMVYERLRTSQRRVYEWRKPGAQVQADVADRVLSATPYLWFDVWRECPRDAQHQVAMMDTGKCSRCDGHERARFAFTGQRPRKRRKRPAAAIVTVTPERAAT